MARSEVPPALLKAAAKAAAALVAADSKNTKAQAAFVQATTDLETRTNENIAAQAAAVDVSTFNFAAQAATMQNMAQKTFDTAEDAAKAAAGELLTAQAANDAARQAIADVGGLVGVVSVAPAASSTSQHVETVLVAPAISPWFRRIAVAALVLAILALIGCGLLWWLKPSESDVGAVKRDVSSLSGALGTVTTMVTKLQADHKGLATQVSDVEATVNAVKEAFDKVKDCIVCKGEKPKQTTSTKKKVSTTTKTDCKPNCVPTPVAHDRGHSAAINDLCTITAIKGDDRSNVQGRLVITKHATTGQVLITRVKEFTKEEKEGNIIGKPVWTPFTSPGTCPAEQALVRANWAQVLEMTKLPNDCKPT